jgi:hypothetical protein
VAPEAEAAAAVETEVAPEAEAAVESEVAPEAEPKAEAAAESPEQSVEAQAKDASTPNPA